jgi:glc operon protein GlcG
MSLIAQRSLSIADAAEAITASAAAAKACNVAVCVAVADRAGHLLAFARLDSAPVLSIALAQDKAWSVAAFNGLPTDAWPELLQGDAALFHGLVKTDRLIIFGGGKPVLVDGELVGALGVSGGTAEQDAEIAAAGAAAISGTARVE